MFEAVRSVTSARSWYRRSAAKMRASSGSETVAAAKEMLEAANWYHRQIRDLRVSLGRTNPVLCIAG